MSDIDTVTNRSSEAYARARSVWTDIKILLATPAAVVGGKGAA